MRAHNSPRPQPQPPPMPSSLALLPSPPSSSGSAKSCPPTSPDVLLSKLRDCQSRFAQYPAHYQSIIVPHQQLASLGTAILAHPDLTAFLDTQARPAYDEQTERLTLKMPSKTHERVTNAFGEIVEDQLKELRKQYPALENICQMASARINFPNTDGENARILRVLETGYSQTGKDLSEVARSHIRDSKGHIRAVICLDLPYSDAKKEEFNLKATISLWKRTEVKLLPEENRVQGKTELDSEHTFRTADGDVVNGVFQIPIEYFLGTKALMNLDDTARGLNIEIPFVKLAEELKIAEEMEDTPRSRSSSPDWSWDPNDKPASPESIQASTEAEFRQREDDSSQERMKNDHEYKEKAARKRKRSQEDDDEEEPVPPRRSTRKRTRESSTST